MDTATECSPEDRSLHNARRPWEVARWGRLLAGTGVLLSATMGLLIDPLWHLGTLAVAMNLVVTSLTDRCPLRDCLLRMGAREREDLFFPGGVPRPGLPANPKTTTVGVSRHAHL